MVLVFEVCVKPTQLLPFDYGENCIQGVEIRDLNILGVFIVTSVSIRKCDMFWQVIILIDRARGNTDDTT